MFFGWGFEALKTSSCCFAHLGIHCCIIFKREACQGQIFSCPKSNQSNGKKNEKEFFFSLGGGDANENIFPIHLNGPPWPAGRQKRRRRMSLLDRKSKNYKSFKGTLGLPSSLFLLSFSLGGEEEEDLCSKPPLITPWRANLELGTS